MRKTKEILRLHAAGHSQPPMSRRCGLARSTVAPYLQRAAAAGIQWPLPESLDEATVEQQRFPSPSPATSSRGIPEGARVHQELRRPGVTLWLLWQEYKTGYPEGYQYPWFCRPYRAWAAKTEVVMRQTHRAGETVFGDQAGQTVPLVDRHPGDLRAAVIFVAVLGASNQTDEEAAWSQSLEDWLMAHVRAFEFFGGVPAIVVPDKLKAGVHRAHRQEPDLNPSYADLAAHDGVAVIPARARRPRDKAKVEAGVLVVERWILARLRHLTLFSLDELNRTLRSLLTDLNGRPFKKRPGSRQPWFDSLERPALKPLPAKRSLLAPWKTARVNLDQHLEVERHAYSVPYPLVRQEVEVRLSAVTVEVFPRGQRGACHRRNPLPGRHTTVAAHMPKPPREYAEWTPQRFIRWAEQPGPSTATLVERILASRPHPQPGYRSCLGIRRLGKTYGAERLEAACRRAVARGALSYKSVESILKRGLDRQALPSSDTATEAPTPLTHANLRGPDYDP